MGARWPGTHPLPGEAEMSPAIWSVVPFILIGVSESKPRADPAIEDVKRPRAVFQLTATQTCRSKDSPLNPQTTVEDPSRSLDSLGVML